ncbi:MAG: TIGR02147 family protein, partial [Fibrobacteria bacterium]|nr:TIGR02147 family protein [Fibrobacteria bacterium]
MTDDKTNIYLYFGYRKYLSDICEYKKQNEKGFSFREFARRSGVKSPNFLERLVAGTRNLKHSTIPKVSGALDHTPEEAKYFENLVYFDQAGTTDEKAKFYKELNKLRAPY